MRHKLQNVDRKVRIKRLTYEELKQCDDKEFVIECEDGFYLAKRPLFPMWNTGDCVELNVKYKRDFGFCIRPHTGHRVYKILGAEGG